MKNRAFTGSLIVFAILSSPSLSAASSSIGSETGKNEIGPAVRAAIVKGYGNLPLSFQENKGPVHDSVRYLSRGPGYTLLLSSTEAVLTLQRGSVKPPGRLEPVEGEQIRIRCLGTNPEAKITGTDELPGKSNYFIGTDPANWRTDVSNYAKVKIEGLYPGTDLVYYGNRQQLEFDWIVKPGADPKAIRFAVEGDAGHRLDAEGNLILDEKGDLRLNRPMIYQAGTGSRTEIAGGYVLFGNRDVGFRLDNYDPRLPLVIDPVLSYSTFLGGSMAHGYAIAVDSSGNAYVSGEAGTGFPLLYPFQGKHAGGMSDIFVAKLNPWGSALIYSTYIGGSDRDAQWMQYSGNGIAVDGSGNVYITGTTFSSDFPTRNALQVAYSGGGSDAFVTKLNASGNALVYSTYIGGGGKDQGFGIAVSSSGNAFVTGSTDSSNFPKANPFQGSNTAAKSDAFAIKMDASGSALLYSYLYGGSENDYGTAIALDSADNAYLTGRTGSTNFPTKNPFQSTNKSPQMGDAFVTKVNALGEVVYSTYLGGDYTEEGSGIAVDASGNVYVTGFTGSPNFPTANAFQPTRGGGFDVFITKLNSSGNALVYSTFLGGAEDEYGGGIAVDSSGNVYVTGRTESTNFPTAGPFQPTGGGASGDAFVATLDSSGGSLLFSSYLGGANYEHGNGIAVDSARNIYVTGVSLSADFPTAHPFQPSLAGMSAAFVVKIGSPHFKVAANPAGCRFQVDGSTYTSDQYFAWQAGSSHTISVPMPQDTAGTRCVLTGWSDGGPATHTINAPGTTTTYTANFSRLHYLSTSLTPEGGGDIIASPASTDGYYVEGTQVQLTARPRFGYMFWGWSGHVGGTLNQQTLKMWSPFSVSAHFFAAPSMSVQAGGAATYQTPGSETVAHVGYAVAEVAPGGVTPYGTAVFSFKQNGVTVSEAGVPASPPTTRARIFVEYRNDVYALPGRSEAGLIDIDTGIAVVNPGPVNADVTYTLRDSSGNAITTGHGVVAAGAHFACFIDQLNARAAAPDFNLPADFPIATQFGSLEISSSQPLSILGLRGTVNQRSEFFMTTTPVADLRNPPSSGSLYFPQFADGGGYSTSLVLLNTSDDTEIGNLHILDDYGMPLIVKPEGGAADSVFRYAIPPGGAFRFQTDGSPAGAKIGWVRLTPVYNQTPVGSGVFSYNPGNILVSESGIPGVTSTTRARIYVDLSRNHNTGLAIANVDSTPASIEIKAFRTDGSTAAGTSMGPLQLAVGGHDARFADQFIAGLPQGFTGVLDISSATPFAALTLRSLTNERGEFLMTTFPIVDANVTAPLPYFPQVADGAGYTTELILLISPIARWGAGAVLYFYSEDGTAWKTTP